MNDRRIYTDILQIFTVVGALFLSTKITSSKNRHALILSKRARR